MLDVNARRSGTFKIGGDVEVCRLGFGAMRVTGKGIWGEPEDRAGALATLRRLPEIGVNFIDTADSYGPDTSERLIHEALHPYGRITVATKGGLVRAGPDRWQPLGRPDYLRQQVHMSLRHLGLERLGLWQLHRIDPTIPRDEQFGAIAEFQKEGLIHHVGLSEVSVEEIEAAFERCEDAGQVMRTIDRALPSMNALRVLPDLRHYDRAEAARAAAYQRHVKPLGEQP